MNIRPIQMGQQRQQAQQAPAFKGWGEVSIKYHQYTEEFGQKQAAKLSEALGKPIEKGVREFLEANGIVDAAGNIVSKIKKVVVRDGTGYIDESTFLAGKQVDIFVQKGGRLRKPLELEGTRVILAGGEHADVTSAGKDAKIYLVGSQKGHNGKRPATITAEKIIVKKTQLQDETFKGDVRIRRDVSTTPGKKINVSGGGLKAYVRNTDLEVGNVDGTERFFGSHTALGGDNSTLRAGSINNYTFVSGENSVLTAEKISRVDVWNEGSLKAPEGKSLLVERKVEVRKGFLEGNITAKEGFELKEGSDSSKATLNGRIIELSPDAILPNLKQMDEAARKSLPRGRRIRAFFNGGNPNKPAAKA